ncbi:MAG: TorF family putative porin [Opitutaceae bacterium]
MKAPALILAFLIFTIRVAGASGSTTGSLPPAPAPAGTWNTTFAVVSQYMSRGVRLGGAAAQPNLEFAAGNLSLGLWSSFPLEKMTPRGYDPEVDLYASYTKPISAAVDVTTGLILYTYPRAERNLGFFRWTFEPSLALNYTTGMGIRLTPRVYFDTILEGPTAELSAAYALPLASLGTELDLSATLGTYLWRNSVQNTANKVKNSGDFWLAQLEVPFQVGARSRLTLGFAYTRGSNNFIKEGIRPKTVNLDAVGRGVVTVKYAYTF